MRRSLRHAATCPYLSGWNSTSPTAFAQRLSPKVGATPSELTSLAATPTALAESTPTPFPTPHADPFKLNLSADNEEPVHDQLHEQPPWWMLSTPDASPAVWPQNAAQTSRSSLSEENSDASVSDAVGDQRLPIASLFRSSSSMKEDAEVGAPVITKEMVWDACKPFFEQIVDSLHDTVVDQMKQKECGASLETMVQKQLLKDALQNSFRSRPPLQGKQSVAERAAMRWTFLRKQRSSLLKLKFDPLPEVIEPPHANSYDSSSSRCSLNVSHSASADATPIADIAQQVRDQVCDQVRSIEAAAQQVDTTDNPSSMPMDNCLGAPGVVPRPDIVCCHWKNRGWCRYHAQQKCKFAHPDHKRGVGHLMRNGKQRANLVATTFQGALPQWPVPYSNFSHMHVLPSAVPFMIAPRV